MSLKTFFGKEFSSPLLKLKEKKKHRNAKSHVMVLSIQVRWGKGNVSIVLPILQTLDAVVLNEGQ